MYTVSYASILSRSVTTANLQDAQREDEILRVPIVIKDWFRNGEFDLVHWIRCRQISCPDCRSGCGGYLRISGQLSDPWACVVDVVVGPIRDSDQRFDAKGGQGTHRDQQNNKVPYDADGVHISASTMPVEPIAGHRLVVKDLVDDLFALVHHPMLDVAGRRKVDTLEEFCLWGNNGGNV